MQPLARRPGGEAVTFGHYLPEELIEFAAEVERWEAFAKRVSFHFPFPVELHVDACSPRLGSCCLLRVELHVLDRETREPIRVSTRRHAPLWSSDYGGEANATRLVFDLVTVALIHEMRESIRVDGKLVDDPHAVRPTP